MSTPTEVRRPLPREEKVVLRLMREALGASSWCSSAQPHEATSDLEAVASARGALAGRSGSGRRRGKPSDDPARTQEPPETRLPLQAMCSTTTPRLCFLSGECPTIRIGNGTFDNCVWLKSTRVHHTGPMAMIVTESVWTKSHQQTGSLVRLFNAGKFRATFSRVALKVPNRMASRNQWSQWTQHR